MRGWRFCLGVQWHPEFLIDPGRRADLRTPSSQAAAERRSRRDLGDPKRRPGRARGDRIAKWLARAGVASRRDAEKLIAAGQVTLNRQPVTHPATFVASGDIVQVGRRGGRCAGTRPAVALPQAGRADDHPSRSRRPAHGVPENAGAMPRVVSVGRLDLNSEGLLLLTNDGALARQLELPGNGWIRRYRARVHGDFEQPGGYSLYPWYALRTNYAAAVAEAGGVPVALPHHAELAADMLDAIDALVVTGGAFDVDPALYGAADAHPTVSLKAGRTQAERALLEGALARDMPVLGICGGEQLLAVALGGTLIQHIPDSVADPLAHEQPNPRDQAGHAVRVLPGTLLHRIVGRDTMEVNSSHHQAVLQAGPRGVVNALAADGVIEGVEDPGRRFCLGVQWHPEFLIDGGDALIFAAFVRAAS